MTPHTPLREYQVEAWNPPLSQLRKQGALLAYLIETFESDVPGTPDNFPYFPFTFARCVGFIPPSPFIFLFFMQNYIPAQNFFFTFGFLHID